MLTLVADIESSGDFPVRNSINKPVHLTSVETPEPLRSLGVYAWPHPWRRPLLCSFQPHLGVPRELSVPFLTEAVSSVVGVLLNLGVTPPHSRPLCKHLSSEEGLLGPLHPQAFGGLCSLCWPPSLSSLRTVSLAAASQVCRLLEGGGHLRRRLSFPPLRVGSVVPGAWPFVSDSPLLV